MSTTRRNNNSNRVVYYVDSFLGGIAFGKLPIARDSFESGQISLAFSQPEKSKRPSADLSSKAKNEALFQIELELMKLSKRGVLRETEFYFGVNSDPLHPFEGRFDLSMKILELFQRYVPGKLYVQTRSPLIVLALPILKKLGEHVAVHIAVETHKEDIVQRYTPNFPKAEERFKAALALKRFGVEVGFQISPLLPYGKWRKDAKKFADLLAFHADYVEFSPIRDGSQRNERNLKDSELIKKLLLDRQYEYLHVNSCDPIIEVFEEHYPERLEKPTASYLKEKQLPIFAA